MNSGGYYHELRYNGYGTECDKLKTPIAKMCQTT